MPYYKKSRVFYSLSATNRKTGNLVWWEASRGWVEHSYKSAPYRSPCKGDFRMSPEELKEVRDLYWHKYASLGTRRITDIKKSGIDVPRYPTAKQKRELKRLEAKWEELTNPQ